MHVCRDAVGERKSKKRVAERETRSGNVGNAARRKREIKKREISEPCKVSDINKDLQ